MLDNNKAQYQEFDKRTKKIRKYISNIHVILKETEAHFKKLSPNFEKFVSTELNNIEMIEGGMLSYAVAIQRKDAELITEEKEKVTKLLDKKERFLDATLKFLTTLYHAHGKLSTKIKEVLPTLEESCVSYEDGKNADAELKKSQQPFDNELKEIQKSFPKPSELPAEYINEVLQLLNDRIVHLTQLTFPVYSVQNKKNTLYVQYNANLKQVDFVLFNKNGEKFEGSIKFQYTSAVEFVRQEQTILKSIDFTTYGYESDEFPTVLFQQITHNNVAFVQLNKDRNKLNGVFYHPYYGKEFIFTIDNPLHELDSKEIIEQKQNILTAISLETYGYEKDTDLPIIQQQIQERNTLYVNFNYNETNPTLVYSMTDEEGKEYKGSIPLTTIKSLVESILEKRTSPPSDNKPVSANINEMIEALKPQEFEELAREIRRQINLSSLNYCSPIIPRVLFTQIKQENVIYIRINENDKNKLDFYIIKNEEIIYGSIDNKLMNLSDSEIANTTLTKLIFNACIDPIKDELQFILNAIDLVKSEEAPLKPIFSNTVFSQFEKLGKDKYQQLMLLTLQYYELLLKKEQILAPVRNSAANWQQTEKSETNTVAVITRDLSSVPDNKLTDAFNTRCRSGKTATLDTFKKIVKKYPEIETISMNPLYTLSKTPPYSPGEATPSTPSSYSPLRRAFSRSSSPPPGEAKSPIASRPSSPPPGEAKNPPKSPTPEKRTKEKKYPWNEGENSHGQSAALRSNSPPPGDANPPKSPIPERKFQMFKNPQPPKSEHVSNSTDPKGESRLPSPGNNSTN